MYTWKYNISKLWFIHQFKELLVTFGVKWTYLLSGAGTGGARGATGPPNILQIN